MNILLYTFNCAKTPQPTASCQLGFETALRSAKFPPQLLVIGLEELTSILAASFHSTDSHLRPFESAVNTAACSVYSNLNVNYTLVARSQLGAIATLVFGLKSLDPSINSPFPPLSIVSANTAASHRGYFYSSLKGAAAVRLTVSIPGPQPNLQQLTFVTAHLAANEGRVESRNADFHGIVCSLGFEDGFGAYKPGSHFFFMGDLNYRASRNDQGDDDNNTPLISTDELSTVLQNKSSFFGFAEPPITFPPTYKFVSKSTYSSKRTPSWCDRILHLPYSAPATVISYNSVPQIDSSDHKPVFQVIHVPDEPPAPVLSYDQKNPLHVKIRPQYAASPTFVDVSLSKYHGYYLRWGNGADLFIGSAVYLGSTTRGRIYLTAILILLFLVLVW